MKSIKTKLMFWLMAWITAILGTTGLFSYWHNQERNEADYQSQRAAVKARLAMSLPHSVWQLDDENVRLTLDSELSWPSIIAISVKGESGLSLGRSHDADGSLRDMPPSEEPRSDDMLNIPIIYQGKEHLGNATVYLSRQALAKHQRDQLIELSAQILLLDV